MYEQDRIARQRAFGKGGDDRPRHGEIGGRIVQLQPARDAHVYILIKHLFAGAFFHHSQQQRNTAGIHPAYCAAGHVIKAVRRQRL